MTIIDAHAHIGLRPTGNIQHYLRMMERSGVARTVLVAGDNLDPVRLADFIRGREPLLSATPRNDLVEAAFRAHPDRFLGFFTVDPAIHTIEDVLGALEAGFVGLKFNPLVHQVDFGHPLAQEVFRLSQQRRVPLYTHVTLNPTAAIETLHNAIREFAPVLIVGHMGFAAGDWEAIELARDCDDVYLETSVGAYLAIKEALRVAGPEKLIFGSEGPAHHQLAELAKIRALEQAPAVEAMILGGNILRLLSASSALPAAGDALEAVV